MVIRTSPSQDFVCGVSDIFGSKTCKWIVSINETHCWKKTVK